MTEYRIVFANATPSAINIKAEKVNLGAKKLWLYDAEDHLIGCYQWEHLVGFDVVGSAEQQAFTDALLHERLPSREPVRDEAIEQRGPTVVLLEEAVAILKQSTEEIRRKWCKIDDEVKNKTETEALVKAQEGTLRRLQAALLDGNMDLQKILGMIQMEFKNMGLPAARTLETSELAPPPGLTADNLGKKKWFS
jgi:hypothetical protein